MFTQNTTYNGWKLNITLPKHRHKMQVVGQTLKVTKICFLCLNIIRANNEELANKFSQEIGTTDFDNIGFNYFLSTFPFTFNFITSIFSSPSLSTTFTAILCSPALNKYVCLPVLSNKISGLKLVSL